MHVHKSIFSWWKLALYRKQVVYLCLLTAMCLCFSTVFGVRVAEAATPYQASNVLGQTDFNSSATGSTAENFGGQMTSIAEDPAGHRLFVADYDNKRVLVFNLSSSNKLIDKTADNVLGQTDFTSNTGGTTQSSFEGPTALAFDEARNRLFVGDGYGANNRVLVFDLSGGITDGMDASYVLGQTNFTNSGSGTSQSGFSDNGGVSFDSVNNRLFVSDYGNNRVLVFDLSGGITDGMDASYVLGQTDFSSNSSAVSAGGMNNPWGVYYDSAKSRLYVADYSASRVLVFDLSGGITDGMDASYVLGQAGFSNNGGHTTQNGLTHPVSITSDTTGNLLFVHDGDNKRVVIYDAASITNNENAIGVLGKPDFTTATCQTSVSGMCSDGFDSAMYFDNDNRILYVNDSDNHRALVFNFVNITLGTGDDVAALPPSTTGALYSYQLPLAGNQGSLSCQLTSGSLPKGLTLSNNCTITGKPTSIGTFSFQVTAFDNNGVAGTFSDFQNLSLTVKKGNSVVTSAANNKTDNNGAMLADTGDSVKVVQYLAGILTAISLIVLVKSSFRTKIKKYVR